MCYLSKASKYFSGGNSKTLFMTGTDVLGSHTIHAHASVRPVKKGIIRGRNQLKGKAQTEICQKNLK
ncbi:MAG: hypothetical protein GDA51_11210 [Ekhidna sp.]|nr:hypothetical protein [Ekhidna sp.]MBC6427007.1 hypothetical protein [Ekhidna sp.]